MATRTTFALVVAPVMFAATIAMADTIPFARTTSQPSRRSSRGRTPMGMQARFHPVVSMEATGDA